MLNDWEQSRPPAPEEALAKAKYFKGSLGSLRIKAKINKKLQQPNSALEAQAEAIEIAQSLQQLVLEELYEFSSYLRKDINEESRTLKYE